jgi:hypothetical protein
MKKNLFILSASAILLFACGSHQAHHKGISYSKMPTWKANKKGEQKDVESTQPASAELNVVSETEIDPTTSQAIYASTVNEFEGLDLTIASFSEPEKPLVALEPTIQSAVPSDSCDEIIMRSGDILSGKIIELNPTQVKYKKCDYLTGPMVVINKEDVFMLRYSNGSKEVFNQTKSASNDSAQPGTSTNPNEAYFKAKKTDSMTNWGLAVGILGCFPILGFPLSAIAIIFGAVGMKKTSDKKNRMDPIRRKAIASFVLGLIGAVGSIVVGIWILSWW